MTIKEIRLITGLSQVKFGELYHIPRRTIQDWETDRMKPPIYLVELLERAVTQDFPNEKKDSK